MSESSLQVPPISINNSEGELEALTTLFEAYAGFGSRNGKNGITIKNINRWFRQAGLIGMNGINSLMIEGIFAVTASNRKRLLFSEFQTFMKLVGREKNVTLEEMEDMLIDAGEPQVKGVRDAIRKYLKC